MKQVPWNRKLLDRFIEVANATAIHSLSLNALVRVKEASCCETPVSISVMNVGNGATVDMNVVVTKVF